jgi:CIC family chloride channel protein
MPFHSTGVYFRFLRLKLKLHRYLLLLSLFAGLGGGFIALVLKSTVFFLHRKLTGNQAFDYHNLLLFVYPMVGITFVVLFKKLVIKDMGKHNISTMLFAISQRKSRLPAHKMFSSVVGGIFTAGFGGSIGLESPIISSGGAIGSNLGRYFQLTYKETTLLLACGSAGAISAIFHTPLAAIVFAVEVLLIDLNRFSLIPLLTASISGAVVTNIFFQDEILFEFVLRDPYLVRHTGFYLLLGVLTGLVSVYFTRTYLHIEQWVEKYSVGRRLLVGGLIIGSMLFLFPALYGEGYQVVKALFAGDYSSVLVTSLPVSVPDNAFFFGLFFLFLLLLKVVATSVTLSSGGVGGIFAPSLFTGAITGTLFGHILNQTGLNLQVSESNFTLVGMAGVLSGVLHAPLTGLFLIAETTRGYELIVPLMIVITISFLVVKRMEPHSLFTRDLEKTGKLITHHKDRAVLTFMELAHVIERDFSTVSVNGTLGDLVEAITRSKRDIFPVIDEDGILNGIIFLSKIRQIMFKQELYDKVKIEEIMELPPHYISMEDSMKEVVRKFEESEAWNLPVIWNARYQGMVSRSKLFSMYRGLLLEISAE